MNISYKERYVVSKDQRKWVDERLNALSQLEGDTTTAKELFWCAFSFLVGAISLYGFMWWGWFQ